MKERPYDVRLPGWLISQVDGWGGKVFKRKTVEELIKLGCEEYSKFPDGLFVGWFDSELIKKYRT